MHKKSLNIVKSAIPIIDWLPRYNLEKGIADCIAGVTVGLTLIPQSIAYAGLAGLPPQYGLYSSLFGGFVYAVFGTVPELHIAPTALLSLLTLTYSSTVTFGVLPASVLLCFYAGVLEVICGVLHLGFLVDFVSAPAVAGLTSAGAILIASSQLKNLFGVRCRGSGNFISIWGNFLRSIQNINLWDTTLSICCCSLLLALRKVKDYGVPPASENKTDERSIYRKFKVFLWFLSVGRNAMVVIISTIIAYILIDDDMHVISISGRVQSGLPNISFPPFEVAVNNKTYTIFDTARELGTGIIVIPFIAILANVGIAKSFSRGKVFNASQEMLAVGMCNIAGSFVSSIPVNASFTRAAVNNASGVKTPFAAIYTSLMVILSLTFLTPFFAYIPKATLASVVVCAVIFMVEVTTSKLIWKLNKIDLLPLLSTFFACLFLGLEIGILIGIAVDIILLLFYISRPKIDVQRVTIQGKEYVKVTPSGSVYYPSAEFFRDRVNKNEISINNNREGNVIIIDCSKLTKTDFTAARCLGTLAQDLQKSNKTIAFLKLQPNLSKLLTKTCRNCIFAFTDDALSDILKERRNSDILDGYKNVKVEGESRLSIFHISAESLDSKL